MIGSLFIWDGQQDTQHLTRSKRDVRQVEPFDRAFSTLVPRVLEMGLDTHDASEALAA